VHLIHSAGGPVLLLLLDNESEWAVAWEGELSGPQDLPRVSNIAVNWGRTEARCWLITDSIWCMGVLPWAWLITHWMCCSITYEICTWRRFSRDWLIDRSPNSSLCWFYQTFYYIDGLVVDGTRQMGLGAHGIHCEMMWRMYMASFMRVKKLLTFAMNGEGKTAV